MVEKATENTLVVTQRNALHINFLLPLVVGSQTSWKRTTHRQTNEQAAYGHERFARHLQGHPIKKNRCQSPGA